VPYCRTVKENNMLVKFVALASWLLSSYALEASLQIENIRIIVMITLLTRITGHQQRDLF